MLMAGKSEPANPPRNVMKAGIFPLRIIGVDSYFSVSSKYPLRAAIARSES
jgi:hypothetical protein